jgi:predicted RNA binding protein YcfA (HicA-like mRNA interferase family)
MTKHDKLLQSVFNAPVSIRFEDVCKVAELIGFSRKGGQGSHVVYGRDDEIKLLNFQNRNGSIKPYQLRQLRDMVKKYGNQ